MKAHSVLHSRQWLILGSIVVAIAIGIGTWPAWSAPVAAWLHLPSQQDVAGGSKHDDTQHGHIEHDTTQHDNTARDSVPAVHVHGDSPQRMSVALTPQARENLGLTAEFLRPAVLSTYRRSITLPAVIAPKPGRSQLVVASPLNGIVTHVHAVAGQAVMPGDLLMEVKLTYEDLVETQAEYLKSISELGVENREIARLEEATRSGAVSGKSLLERRYAKEKLEASLRSQREALRMHGLSTRQVEAIATDGRLLQALQIVAPDIDRHTENEELRLSKVPLHAASFQTTPDAAAPLKNNSDSQGSDQVQPGAPTTAGQEPRNDHHRPLIIDDLQVHKGQAVTAGEKLCSLSDYSELFIEGKAFEQDIAAISLAAERGWSVEAVFSGSSGTEVVRDLKLVFVSNAIDEASRTLSLFVNLPNSIVRDETDAEGQRYLYWKYRLGQRIELRVPVELWEGQFVLPVDAVVQEGPEWFVFQRNGSRFDRVPVHVRHRDQHSVVVANDGSIYPGDVIALKSAHQLQMAIKNQASGGVDPHAGHSH